MQLESIPTANGRTLDVYVSGPEQGQVLLFHDGTPGAGLLSDRFVSTAADRNLRSVSFSRPGYGSSTRRPGRTVADVVDDSLAVLDHLGVARCYTIGFSGGGPHTLACAARLPERVVAASVVGCVAPFDADGLDYFAGFAQENIDEFSAALAGPEALQAFLGTWLDGLRVVTGDQVADSLGGLIPPVDRAALTGEYADALAADLRQAVRAGTWGWHDDDLAFIRPWGFRFDEIKVPVSLWQGEQDKMVPFAHGAWLARSIPGVRANLMPDHGHLSLIITSAEAVLDDLIATADRAG
jgi:pimeloyl-ACP methyl ester carboxylesterase